MPDEGGNSNFASTFAMWDLLFGTFYMPAGRLPANYGVDDPKFPVGFLKQLAYPFVGRNAPVNPALSEPPSAIGSARPQRES
jgi:sterol desaturase/sphingolipid hydroxylase (fatty acid hydroxylase superfamily)